MKRFFVDTAIFVYALGRDHPYKQPCRNLVGSMQTGKLTAEASVDLIPEFTHVARRWKLDRPTLLTTVRSVAASCRLHDFEVADLDAALELCERHPALDIRDSIFAATALNRGVELIVSSDRDFDEVAGLKRIDPADERAVAALTS